MGLKKANQTSFKTNWSGIKICSKCNEKFHATAGSQKKCSNCRKCEECGKEIKYSHKRFCNNSCAGKWKYKNYSNIRDIIKQGREEAYKPEAREKIRQAHIGKPKYNMRGENNPNWSGGTYGTERHTLMGRIEYINWRKSVFERDNYTCQICYTRGGKLEADHIIPYIADKSKALDLDNGRTLCKECHRKTDTWGEKAKKFKEIA
jgi:hypothetical protein